MKYSLPVFGRGMTEFIDYDENDVCIRNDDYVGRTGVLHLCRKMQRPDESCYWIIGDFMDGKIDSLRLKTAPDRAPVPRAPEIEDDEYIEKLCKKCQEHRDKYKK